MTRTTSELAFIHGYMLVANTVGGVALTLDDPSWDSVLDQHRHLFDVSPRYHEAHITVEPSPAVSYDDLSVIVADGWRSSRFEHDDVDHIEGKWFLSARHESLSAITAMVDTTVLCLRDAGLTVLRHKIEDAVRDTKCGDPM